MEKDAQLIAHALAVGRVGEAAARAVRAPVAVVEAARGAVPRVRVVLRVGLVLEVQGVQHVRERVVVVGDVVVVRHAFERVDGLHLDERCDVRAVLGENPPEVYPCNNMVS